MINIKQNQTETPIIDCKKCKIVADKFYMDVSSGKLYSPTFVSLLVYNIFRGMSHAGTEGAFYDNEYWKKTGLVDVAYATEIPLPLYKHFLGNIIYFFAKIKAKKTKLTYKKQQLNTAQTELNPVSIRID